MDLRQTLVHTIMDKMKGILAGLALLSLGGLFLSSPLGALVIFAGAGWITWKLYKHLDAKGYKTAATIFIMFFVFPTILIVGGGVGWLVGCVFGMNGCRSPF